MKRLDYFELEQEITLGYSDEDIKRWGATNGNTDADWIYSQMITKVSAGFACHVQQVDTYRLC
jgi:hypothetical protein